MSDKKSKQKVLGIDLGTTNSCVAIIEGGAPRIIENFEGKRVTPSIISFAENQSKLVGDAAKRQAHANTLKTIYAVKRIIGKKFEEVKTMAKRISYNIVSGENGEALVEINGKKLSPSYISGLLLRKLVDDASSYLGYEIKDIVITVPAHFNDSQRQATKQAGEIVGLNVIRIINEPTAAAMAYSTEKFKEGNILVYDLGGGTFDVTLLQANEGLFQVKATDGDTELGGEDFDNEIVTYVLEDFKKKEGIDLSSDRVALYRIKEAAEEAKKELSKAMEAHIMVPFITEGPKNINCTITRSTFESMIKSYVERSITLTEKTIEQSQVPISKIDRIVCVGGSTRVPLVREALQKFIGKPINIDINPDEAVALGAAIQGGVLSGDVSDVVLLDVTSLSLGIEAVGGVFAKLIERNTSIPTSGSKIFTTITDNQLSAQITIFQGERYFVKENKKLGSFELVGIKPAARGEPQIEVSFNIDANGILQVAAKDIASNSEQKIILTPDAGLSKEDIERMIKDAEDQKLIDEDNLKKVELRNSLDTNIYAIEKMLKDEKEKLNSTFISETENKLAEIRIMEDLEIAIEQSINLKTEVQNNISTPQT